MNNRELKLVTMLIKMDHACFCMNDKFKHKMHNEFEAFLENNYKGKFLKYIHSAE